MFAEIIIPLALPKNYTWHIPDEMLDAISIGCRVEVNLGKNKKYAGVVKRIHNEEPTSFEAPRAATQNTHGTGCTLSAAIAAELAKGASLGDAVEAGEPVFTLHAEAPGELEYALDYVTSHPPIVEAS